MAMRPPCTTTTMCGGLILASETLTFEQLASAGWREAHLEWEHASEAAMERLAANDVGGAGAKMAEAVRIANAGFAPDDPRLATSLANHGAALVHAGAANLSGRTLTDAVRIWQDCDSWIATMTAPRVARSSLFHLRMEQRHRPAYEARWRIKWAELAAEARERIGAGAFTLIPAEQAGECLARWRRERPAMLNDTRKLMAAVFLLACGADRSAMRPAGRGG